MNALEVFPEVYAQWRAALRDSWRVADPQLLEQCLARIAAFHEGKGDNEGRIDEADERTLAAIDWVDQYVIDQNGISEEQRQALARHLAPWPLDNFAQAIWIHDADKRARILLRSGADPDEREEADAPPLADGQLSQIPVSDRAFGERIASFLNTVHSLKVLDPETAELVRLRNALHQQCLL